MQESTATLPTKKIIERIIAIGYDEEYIFNCSYYELEDLVVDLKPNCIKEISNICYLLAAYARWLTKEKIINNDDTYQMIKSHNRRVVWLKAKPNASDKYISNEDFNDLIKDIKIYDLNPLYFSVLFRALYEGIYCNDMSVVKNLRASDVVNEKVTLKNDNGESYELLISQELTQDLIELSKAGIFKSNNRYKEIQLDMQGLYLDSCFKLSGRNTTGGKTSYRNAYYKKIRKICSEYLDRNITAKQIFTSGLMYRIANNLKKEGFTVQEAFKHQNRNRKVGEIISSELERCHHNVTVRNFRGLIDSPLDIF